MIGDGDLDCLRRELLSRLDARPWKSWSPELLRAVIGVLDLTPQRVEPQPAIRRLTLIR